MNIRSHNATRFWTLDLRYIVLILLLVILALVTNRVAPQEELTSYIQFALAVSSILLALVAIVHSIVSNAQLNLTLTQIVGTSDSIERSSDSISSVAEQLQTSLQRIPTQLEGIHADVREVKEQSKAQAPNRLAKPKGEDREFKKPQLSKGEIHWFVATSSLIGIAVILIATEAYNKRKQFRFADFTNKDGIEIFNTFYSYGFLVGCGSAGLIQHDTENSVFTIRQVDEEILNNIDLWIDERIQAKEESDTEAEKELGRSFRRDVSMIREYFSDA